MKDAGRVFGSVDFGALLRRYRLEAGLSQEALAERAHMSANGIGALERGYRQAPHRETLALLAEALKLDREQRAAFEAAAMRGRPRRSRTATTTDALRDHNEFAGLPIALTSFVGRDREVDEIAQLVRRERLVTLTGPGGIGKTQTALRAAAALTYAGGPPACFAALAPLIHPSLVLTAIALAAGVKEVPNHPLLDTLIAALKKSPPLIVLDNCEHVIADAARAAEALLSGCPELHILATSREPLHCAGEHVYRIPPLMPDDAIALFADRAGAIDHRFELSDDNAPAVAAICRRLAGIPLAIELAAARANVLSPKAIEQRLGDHLQMLGGGARTAAPRQQTMAATIDWSYQLLSPDEQRIFERLSVFAGGCTLELAAEVCSENGAPDVTFDLLMSLTDKSLVVADLDGRLPRYGLLEPFRHFARERLAARGEEEQVLHRQAAALFALADYLEGEFEVQADRVREIAQEELENWRAVLLWTIVERGEPVLGRRLIARLNLLWQLLPLIGRRWIAAAHERDDGTVPPDVHAAVAYTEAMIAGVVREFELQLATAERVLTEFRMLGDDFGVAGALQMCCAALICMGRTDDAKTVLREALPLAKQTRNPHLLAYAYRCLGFCLGTSHRAAQRCFVRAVRFYKSAEDRFLTARALSELGGCEMVAGKSERGLMHLEQALQIDREFNNLPAIARDLGELAFNLIGQARYDEAKAYATESLELACSLRLDFSIVLALDFLVGTVVLRPRDSPEPKREAYVDAARVLGYADAQLDRMGSGRNADLQAQYDVVLAELQGVLDEHELKALMGAGATQTEEEAIVMVSAAPSTVDSTAASEVEARKREGRAPLSS